MKFVLNQEALKGTSCAVSAAAKEGAFFYQEKEAYSGVRKIAAKVMNDINLVFSVMPQATEDRTHLYKSAVIYGTLGCSPILNELEETGKIDLSKVRDKKEVYLFQLVENPIDGVEQALVIAGSDKLGTIYGLFRLSELIGVSPLVDWSDVKPLKRKELILTDSVSMISKEPSVRYRGFFINDEWPAFGNWATKNFGGFNAQMYDHVFELLLRSKGNYLWPAMWASRFSVDGPGLANAELADEYGIVMGMSHHEPCLRHGEEYRHLRGKDSIYGDAWNFRTNEEGITRFWEDGLKRSGKFENVITVGMRGEADTAILGRDATLADNIELLRDVLKTQNRLIKENVNENLDEVPRMLALYKEVEPYFYGDAQTPGLINSEELENVILMLCDDNHGNLRTLPTDEMRNHKGGYGMYYHFDYHGGPISFEWVNSSYLPKVWEQMTQAYDFGIRELWIVNVGDVCTNEFPLAYFLDLAYDFDKWGTSAINKTQDYTRQWIHQQFNGVLNEEDQQKVFDLVEGYTRISHNRRPEAMNPEVYHPINYKETDELLCRIDKLMKTADELYHSIGADNLPAYFSQIYYPVVANLNLQKMHLLAGKNHLYAKQGRVAANALADQVEACLARDRAVVDEYHTIADGKWYGMGLSEHIGFINWNEDECKYPILMKVMPPKKERILVSVAGTMQVTEGSAWHKNRLLLNDFMEPDVTEAGIELSIVGGGQAKYEVANPHEWLSVSKAGGTLDQQENTMEVLTVRIDRSKMGEETTGEIKIKVPTGTAAIIVPAVPVKEDGLQKNTFIDTLGYISIEAEHMTDKKGGVNHRGEESEFRVIEGYGKTLSAVKVFPTTGYFTPGENAPYVEYRFVVDQAGSYEVELYMQPTNPSKSDNVLTYGIQSNEDEIRVWNVIPSGQQIEDNNRYWAQGVLNNIRKHTSLIQCKEGLNILKIYVSGPSLVLEKLVIWPEGNKPAESYLGPKETYYVGR